MSEMWKWFMFHPKPDFYKKNQIHSQFNQHQDLSCQQGSLPTRRSRRIGVSISFYAHSFLPVQSFTSIVLCFQICIELNFEAVCPRKQSSNQKLSYVNVRSRISSDYFNSTRLMENVWLTLDFSLFSKKNCLEKVVSSSLHRIFSSSIEKGYYCCHESLNDLKSVMTSQKTAWVSGNIAAE